MAAKRPAVETHKAAPTRQLPNRFQTSKSKYSEYTVGRNAISLRNGYTLKASLVVRRTAPNKRPPRDARAKAKGRFLLKFGLLTFSALSATNFDSRLLVADGVFRSKLHQHSATVQNRPYVLCGSPFFFGLLSAMALFHLLQNR